MDAPVFPERLSRQNVQLRAGRSFWEHGRLYGDLSSTEFHQSPSDGEIGEEIVHVLARLEYTRPFDFWLGSRGGLPEEVG